MLHQYREEEEFYPLQLRYVLNENPTNLEEKEWQEKIVFAIQEYFKNKRALILKDADTAIGIMAFNEGKGSIDFFGGHRSIGKEEWQKHFVKRHCMNLRVVQRLV